MSKRDLLRKANAGNAQKRGTEAVLNEDPVADKISTPKATPVKKRIIEEAPVTPEVKVQTEEPIVEPVIEVVKTSEPEPQVEEQVETKTPVVEIKAESIEIQIPDVVEKSKHTKTTETVEITKTIENVKDVETTNSVNTTESTSSSISTISSKSSRMTKPALSANLAKYTGPKISKSIMLTAEDNKYLIKQAAAQKKPIQDIFGEVMADEIEEVKKGNIDEELAESFLKLKANNERRNVLIPEDLSIAISDTACEIPLKQGKFILYALSRKRQSM